MPEPGILAKLLTPVARLTLNRLKEIQLCSRVVVMQQRLPLNTNVFIFPFGLVILLATASSCLASVSSRVSSASVTSKKYIYGDFFPP